MGWWWYLAEYLFSPRTLMTHLIGGGLWTSLLWQRVLSVRGFVLRVLLSQLVTYLLWVIVPHGLTTVVALWVILDLYERAAGPRVVVEKDAVFLTDTDIYDSLQQSISLNLQVSNAQEPERIYIFTSYPYVIYQKNFKRRTSQKYAVDLDQVVDVEAGVDLNVAKAVRQTGSEVSHCFFLIFGDDATATFITESADIRNQWVDALQNLFGGRFQDYQTQWMNSIMDEANIGDDVEETPSGVPSGLPVPSLMMTAPPAKGITLDQSLRILDDVKRPTNRAYAAELFNTFAVRVGSKKVSTLNRQNFSKFFDVTSKRPEIHSIYSRLLKNRRENVLHPQKLEEFMQNEQKEMVPLEQCKAWIKQHEKIIPPFSFTSPGFTTFMMSDDQAIFNRDHRQVYQDMDQPLCHYFIATSHNTYLMKDQLKGKSSVDAYINAFKRGCKCVELDCWDGPNNEPIIYHGHTLTSKILFRDVIIAIREFAFCVSNYPVILSFENHCSVEQQKVMANHLVNILGYKLYTKPVPDDETQLPSPNDLKGYVIVKARKLKEITDEADEVDDDYSGDEDIAGADLTEEVVNKAFTKEIQNEQVLKVAQDADKEQDSESEDGISMDRLSLSENGSVVNGNTEQRDDSDDDSDEKGRNLSRSGSKLSTIGSLLRKTSKKVGRKDKPKIAKMAQELSDLVSYCQAVTFRGFEHAKANHRHCEMSSFAEKKAMKFAKEDCRDYVAYNRHQLSRIYPAGARVDSSNYDPQPMWNVGCQLVALNYQTGSWPMQLNQGLFQDNGGCGYVLKPQFLRLDNSRFDPRGPFNENFAMYLLVRIISGDQVPFISEKNVKSDRTLSVQVRTSGIEQDCHKEKTKSVKNNGYNPVWNEVMGFKMYIPELACIRFQLVEGRDTFLGQYTLPICSVKQGYRRVPLQNKNSEPIPHASLFVHIEVKSR